MCEGSEWGGGGRTNVREGGGEGGSESVQGEDMLVYACVCVCRSYKRLRRKYWKRRRSRR